MIEITEPRTVAEVTIGAVASTAGLGAWLPIETAPKDGKEIIAAWQNNGKEWCVGAVRWVIDKYWPLPGRNFTGWWCSSGGVPYQDPMFWQPLPEAPNV